MTEIKYKMTPRPPKGTRDFGPQEIATREKILETITGIFKRCGATGLDTPTFELRETLMSKYGEESKLIYDLADQGREQLSLRYDLTVPFARYLASNSVGNIKRYQIGKVYRRDNIAVEKGRFREFYQCDFDIAGSYDSMIPDAEVLKVLYDVLRALDLPFIIKLNSRALLDAYLELAGVPEDKLRTVCSSIDKLDKRSWLVVREELFEKGLTVDVVGRLQQFLTLKEDVWTVYNKLYQMSSNKKVRTALEELEPLFNYLSAFGIIDKIQFDLSLARGLDYYTGLIFEAVLIGENKIGSIAAGGRYDNLVKMYGAKNVPCVGVSIGIDRILTILMEREQKRDKNIDVFVASVGENLTIERIRLVRELREAGFGVEMSYKAKPNLKKQIEYALDSEIPLMVLIGGAEIANNCVKVKNLIENDETSISRSDLIWDLTIRLKNFKKRGLYVTKNESVLEGFFGGN